MLATVVLALALDSGFAVIPRPVRLTPHPGAFTLTSATVIVADRSTRELGDMLGDYLFPATGFRLAVRPTALAGGRVISLRLDSTLTRLGDEGYRLEVGPAGVSIRDVLPRKSYMVD